MELKIKAVQVNKVLDYLASKPYIEVYQLIDMLQKLEAISEDIKEED